MAKAPKRGVSVRVDEELLEWADLYAVERAATRSAVLESALEHFKHLAESGVPELPAESGGVHVLGHLGDPDSYPRRAGDRLPSGYLAERSRMFQEMTQGAGKPMSYGGKPKEGK